MVVLVDRISNCPIIRAAHRLNIEIVELQHGSPSKKNTAILIDFFLKKENNPDYYFSFGKFWNKRLYRSYFNKNIKVIGKKFNKKIPMRATNSENFLIIDDIFFKEKTHRKSDNNKKKYNKKILYRVHPNYLNLSTKDKNILNINNIKLSDGSKNNLKDDLKGIKNIICNYSTLAFECAQMNYNVYLLNTNYYEKELYKKIISKKKYLNMIKISKKKLQLSNFYENFSDKRTLSLFSNIINKK